MKICRFRWVELQLDFLCTIHTLEALRKRLGSLPPRLSDIYQDLYDTRMGSLVPEDRRVMRAVLSWLLVGRRQLHTSEVLNLVDTKSATQAILNLCTDFVVLDSTQDLFRFPHLSVRDVL